MDLVAQERKQQAIRLSNTLLAFSGGLVLTLLLTYAQHAGYSNVSMDFILYSQAIFWAVNLGFVGLIYFNFNLKLKTVDPSLSIFQMYWASTSSVFYLCTLNQLYEALYFLIFLSQVFGAFRLNTKQFAIYCSYVVSIFTLAQLSQSFFFGIDRSLESTITTCLVFAFSSFALVRMCAALLRLKTRLKEKNHALNEALNIKTMFLANMSHEIRTPMNGVIGMLSVLKRCGLTDEQMQYTNIAQTSANSLLGIVNDILDYSKIEAGKLSLEIIPFDLEKLIGEIADDFGFQANEKGIELIVDFDQSIPTLVLGDPGRLRQILANLLGNAIKFTKQGEIIIAINVKEQWDCSAIYKFSVRDTGIGITTKNLESLFESFTQADSSTTRLYGGTGLGLSIAYELCHLMNGNLNVTSEVDVGSCFSFTAKLDTEVPASVVDQALVEQNTSDDITTPDALKDRDLTITSSPALNTVTAHEKQDSTHTTAIEQPLITSCSIEKKKILVVIENTTNRLLVTKLLLNAGARVSQAADSIHALKVLSQSSTSGKPFEFAIIDMIMTGIDGSTLAQEIRKDPAYNNLKMVLTSPLIARPQVGTLARYDFCGYISKPIKAKELFNTLSIISAQGNALLSTVPLDNTINTPAKKRTLARILLADDNPTNQQVGVLSLQGLGMDVMTVANGEQAIKALCDANANNAFDLILMDSQMPIMDGLEATRLIRSGEAKVPDPNIPIIALTANATQNDKQKCLDLGMNDYLIKPIDIHSLQIKIRQHLNLDRELLSSPLDNTNAFFEEEEEYEAQTSHNEELPIWLEEDLIARLGGNQERLPQLIDSFKKSLTENCDRLADRLREKDYEYAKDAVHSILGSASNMSAMRLKLSAQRLQSALETQNYNNVYSLFLNLQGDIDEVLELIAGKGQ